MKSIFSTIMTAVLLLSALSACGRTNASRSEEARVTPNTSVTATTRPASSPTPNTKTDANDGTVGNAIGNAAEDAGEAIGDVVGGVGNAVGNAVGAVGTEMDDMVDDTVDDTRGENSATGAGRTGTGTNSRNP